MMAYRVWMIDESVTPSAPMYPVSRKFSTKEAAEIYMEMYYGQVALEIMYSDEDEGEMNVQMFLKGVA